MGKVVPFNGITKLDLPADTILKGNFGKLESVVIMGYDKDGNEVFASSFADGSEVLWLAERIKCKLMEIVDG